MFMCSESGIIHEWTLNQDSLVQHTIVNSTSRQHPTSLAELRSAREIIKEEPIAEPQKRRIVAIINELIEEFEGVREPREDVIRDAWQRLVQLFPGILKLVGSLVSLVAL